MLTPPSDDGVIELIDMNFAVLGTVAATPGSLYTRFRLTAPATAVQTMFGMRWKFAGSSLIAPIGTMAVQPEQPVQDPLRPGAVDVFAVVDVSETAAAADPGGIRRADAMRLLPLLLGPTGGYVASVAIAGDLNPLTVPSPPSTGLLARGRPGAFNYDGAFSYRGAAFGSSPEPYRPKVVFVLTASDVPSTYAGGHLSLTHTIAGHRWPVVALPFGPSPLLVPSLGPIARRDRRDRAAVRLRRSPSRRRPRGLGATARRAPVADDPALGHRPQGGADGRSRAGRQGTARRRDLGREAARADDDHAGRQARPVPALRARRRGRRCRGPRPAPTASWRAPRRS